MTSISALLALLLLSTSAQAVEIKIATWNLNWFTLRPAHDPALPASVHHRTPADIAALRAYATRLNPDVVALEEVDGTTAAATLFDPAIYQIITIQQDVVQQVALAVRRGITVRQNPDLAALDVEPPWAPHRLRHGLDATLAFPGGATLRLLAVHLKTGCHTGRLPNSPRPDCALLAQQIPPLAAWAQARQADQTPFAILGDFNRVLDSPEELATTLGPNLLRVTQANSDPCWGGGAFIDHIILGGRARAWLASASLRVMLYRTTDPADKERLSDHCPVSVRLEVPGVGPLGK